MKIETLKQKSFKKVVIAIFVSVSILSVAIFIGSYAKYRNTMSINIAKGTINYKVPDINTVALYLSNDTGEYSEATDIPTSGYTLNNEPDKTRCEVDKVRDEGVNIAYNNGKIDITGISKKGTKCYLYFDKQIGIPAGTTAATLLNYSDNKQSGAPAFDGIEGNGLYTWSDGDYSSGSNYVQYFRGNIDNNWVVFGKDGTNYIWWRIIRNNSNGSLRMIYSGTSARNTQAPTDTLEMMLTKRTFNTSYDKNYYVGLKYSTDSMHGTTTNASILGEKASTDKTTLYGWYNATLGESTDYFGKLDLTAGFCSDRTHSTTTALNSATDTVSGVSAGSTTMIYYGAYTRLRPNDSVSGASPSLKCPGTSDKITDIPVGMITADEVQMAGMGLGTSLANTNSYLHIGQHYWSMSPYNTDSDGYARVFIVWSSGFLNAGFGGGVNGVRPVVNLKADTQFEAGGTGTSTSPYIVSGT